MCGPAACNVAVSNMAQTTPHQLTVHELLLYWHHILRAYWHHRSSILHFLHCQLRHSSPESTSSESSSPLVVPAAAIIALCIRLLYHFNHINTFHTRLITPMTRGSCHQPHVLHTTTHHLHLLLSSHVLAPHEVSMYSQVGLVVKLFKENDPLCTGFRSVTCFFSQHVKGMGDGQSDRRQRVRGNF